MTRALSTAVKNELATNEIRPIHLITIGIATPVNITDNSFSITDVDLVPKSCKVEITPFCEKSPMANF